MFYDFLKSEETIKMLQCMKLYSQFESVPVEKIIQCMWINSAYKYLREGCKKKNVEFSTLGSDPPTHPPNVEKKNKIFTL